MSRYQRGKPHVPEKRWQVPHDFRDKKGAKNIALFSHSVVDPAADQLATTLFLSALAIAVLGNNAAKSAEKNTPASRLFDERKKDRVTASQSSKSSSSVVTASAAVL